MESVLNQSGASYALVTAAYNEERYLRQTILALCQQTIRPAKWIIVSDGSSDRTDDIVRDFASRWRFIELYRIIEPHPRNFTAQVNAINTGLARLKRTQYDFIGNLDADVTMDPRYFESLLYKFSQRPSLGLAGGFIYEQDNGQMRSRRCNSATSVAHAVQLFRRECLDDVGEYTSFPGGGSDWHIQIAVRMKGWEVEAFPDLHVFHQRRTGEAFNFVRYCSDAGVEDYYMGTHPVFELFKIVRRFQEKPYVVGGLIRFAAFLSAYVTRRKREVPVELMYYLRQEQIRKLKASLGFASATHEQPRKASAGGH